MNLSMNETIKASMQEATRLTRAGRLQDATAMVQRALNGESNTEGMAEPNQAASSPHAKGETIEGSYRVVDEQPSAAQEAPAWRGTVPRYPAQTATPWRPFANRLNDRGLDELLGGKLAGLQGLDTRSSPLAQALPAGATFTSGAFTNQAGSRDYKLYIPSAYHGQPLPLVVMLHGCTQSPDDFAAGTGMNTLVETQPCLVLYPAQPASANPSKCWNWFKASDQQRERGEPAIIAGMTRRMIDQYHLDAGRIYVAGLSAGGAMATTLAMTYPDLYAAVGVHSGLAHGAAKDLPSALAAMQGGGGSLASLNQQAGTYPRAAGIATIPAVIFHGDRDTTVHPSNADRIAAQLVSCSDPEKTPKADSGTQVKHGRVPNGHGYTCTTRRNASGRIMLEQWSIHGAGHAWSGGASRGSCTDPKGPDAAKEMLRFFLTHSKNVASA